jgi:hypothetical protein
MGVIEALRTSIPEPRDHPHIKHDRVVTTVAGRCPWTWCRPGRLMPVTILRMPASFTTSVSDRPTPEPMFVQDLNIRVFCADAGELLRASKRSDGGIIARSVVDHRVIATRQPPRRADATTLPWRR